MLFQNEAKLYGMYHNETLWNPTALHELDAVVFCLDISSEKFAFSLQILRALREKPANKRQNLAWIDEKERQGVMRCDTKYMSLGTLERWSRLSETPGEHRPYYTSRPTRRRLQKLIAHAIHKSLRVLSSLSTSVL